MATYPIERFDVALPTTWPSLKPFTSTKAIRLSDYVAACDSVVVIDHDRLTPEFLAWHERMSRKARAGQLADRMTG